VTCPVCKAPSAGTKPCPGYCEGLAEGREETWRALLERDIAEVERVLEDLKDETRIAQMDAQNAADDVDFCMQMGDSMAERQWWEASAEDYRAHAMREQERSAKASALARYRFAMLADCEAWLVRARAVLGGGA